MCGMLYYKWILDKRLKKQLEEIKQKPIEEQKEIMLDGGKGVSLNSEGVKKNDRERTAKFRELEKLRRRANKFTRANKLSPELRANEGGSEVSLNSDRRIAEINEDFRRNERDTQKGSKPTRPTEL